MKSVLTKIFFFLLISSAVIQAQRLFKLSVKVGGKDDVLSYLTKSGNTYVSAKELSDLLSANCYYNDDALKIELKFSDYTLKFTARNQFVVLSRRSDNYQKVFQLPVSTLYFNDDILIPIQYSLNYLEFCFGRIIRYENSSKTLSISNDPFNSVSFFADNKKEPEPEIKTPEESPKPAEKPVNTKYDIYGMTVEEKSNGTLIRLHASKNVNIPRHSIGNNTLYVFLANTSVAPDIASGIKQTGFVKSIKRTAVTSKNIQLEFALKQGYSNSEAFRDVDGNDILITIHNKLLKTPEANIEEIKSKWVFDTIVLDAGHGGKDPGAIGMTGVKEKDVNLGIILKLGKLIEKNIPNVKVVYTRKTDTFVELYKRGKIANENGGKLFISVHCNSTPQKDIKYRGYEVYLLRPGRTKQAIDIAEFENSVIKYEDDPQRYQKLTDENFILVSMAHSQYMRYSEKFSDLLDQDWKKNVEIPVIGVKQAGFYVLVGASMPSVLIESGFLTNRKDEAYLKSTRGQNDIAKSIYLSIKKYIAYYDKAIDN